MNLTMWAGGLAMLLFWGVWGILIKLVTKDIGMQALIWGQVGSLAVFPIYFVLFKDMLPLQIRTGAIALGIATGALGVLGSMTLYVLLRVAPASVVVPISALYPIVTVILAYFVLHEELSLTRVAGVACAIVAIWLLSL